jgi:hypothetical protein
MSNPTGNVYLQVYNKASGKFIEIPENVAAIAFIAETGVSGFFPLSGFSFSNSIRIRNEIRNMPINLGLGNITGSQLGGSVGSSNGDYLTDIHLITGGFRGNYNFGTSNFSINSVNNYALGIFNYGAYNTRCFTLGAGNINSGQFVSLNLGFSNSLNSGERVSVFGQSNTLDSGLDLILVGSQNTISEIKDYLILGSNNQILKSSNHKILGNTNYLSGDISGADFFDSIFSFGDFNTFKNSNFALNFGNNNTYQSSYQNINIGNDNTNFNNQQNVVFGSLNDSQGTGNYIFGNTNIINGVVNNIYGDNNSTNSNDVNATIFGNNNNLSGTNSSSIFGSNNTLDQEIINILYQVELTGITGLGVGQTLFTGVTGYVMLGGYKNIPGSGGNNNFFIGNNNQTSLNQSSYILGDGNQVLNNLTSYVFGSSNYLEKNTNSYAFGSNNSVSGFQNYVIGNNNTIRSGDYNSILIGISHEFTGAYKVASVNIASVDSSIEVAPNEVKINSPTRMKFNNEHVTVASDLNNYLNTSNGLSNSGSFGSYVINDPNYTTLADQIELQSFAYSGRENRYYGGFSGFNASSLNAYNFTGFFRQQPVLFYGGLHSIYGNNFYQSNDQDFEILFSRDVEPVTGNWIISPKSSLGLLFYNKSTNTGIFPVSNWITTGSPANITKVTGYNPAPSFTYSSSFTGFSPKQKINSSTLYSSNYFSNFGITSYPSTQDDIAVLYGAHTDPKNNPSWLIIDKYSSGVYYINKSVPLTTTPQTGWIATGYMGYTGRNPEDLTNALSGIKISLGTRSGIISSYDPTYGTIYVPFFY